MERTIERAKKRYYFDYNLLFILIFLIAFGLVMLYSSSSYISANKYGDSTHYLKLQLRNLAIGVVPFVFFILVDYRHWKKWWVPLYAIALGLCVLTLIPGIGGSSHGSERWLSVGPISFQPSEIAKIAIIFSMAWLIEAGVKSMDRISTLLKMLAIMIPLFGIVAYQNTSTAIIMIAIAACMLFVGSPKYKPFFLIVGIVAALGGIFILAGGYRMTRVAAWLHPDQATGDEVYQTLEGLYAIGSGGLFGKGLGQSMQKLGNVPESQNDFIFSIICEELGLFGAICVILLYILLLWRMLVIANNAADLYGSMLVVGIMAHMALQVILHIAVNTNTIPNTGITLPFFSYGGTSIVILMAEMGVVLGVSRQIRLEDIA